MQYSIILSLLAASGALSTPHNHHQVHNEIRVALSDLGETGAQVTLEEGIRDTAFPSTSGPFASVELRLGKGVQQKDLRCQILDDSGNPITVLRGENTDISFGDGGKGPWTFRASSLVSQVICDPTFQKIGSDATELRVVLENQATETGSQTVFAEGQREEQPPVATSGPFQTVELRVGELVEQQDYRCQVLDNFGHPIVVLRGKSRDITFSDAGKGEWTFETPSEVSSIICDPTFVKAA